MLNKSQKQFAEAMYSALGTDVVSRNDINTFQKENGYKKFPDTREERAKRFFANGKYASGKYKIWLELGGYNERIS